MVELSPVRPTGEPTWQAAGINLESIAPDKDGEPAILAGARAILAGKYHKCFICK
jgi:hypothetical protein